MNNVDVQYIKLVENILETGTNHSDRTGVGTLSLFGTSLRFNLSEGFPILTTKKVFYRQAFHETLWMFIQGSSDCTYLKDNNTTIWGAWTQYTDKYPNGTIGNMYGTVLRSYRLNKEDPDNIIDQLQRCVDMIKTNPNSRRIVMTAFDPRFVADENLSFSENVAVGNGVLNPCHSNFIQFKVVDGKLSGYFTQRSGDLFLRNSV
jgi:thymidylate synthase